MVSYAINKTGVRSFITSEPITRDFLRYEVATVRAGVAAANMNARTGYNSVYKAYLSCAVKYSVEL